MFSVLLKIVNLWGRFFSPVSACGLSDQWWEADGEMEEERFTFVDIYLAEEDGFITKGIQCIIWTEE